MMIEDRMNRTWRRTWVLAATVAAALGIALLAPTHAQTPGGEIAGQVVDPAGDPLPGVTVTVVNRGATEPEPRLAVTDREGRYRIADLQGGTHTVIFELPGFHRAVRGDVDVRVSSTLPVDVELAPGVDADVPVTVTIGRSRVTINGGFGHALECALPPSGAIEDCRPVVVAPQIHR